MQVILTEKEYNELINKSNIYDMEETMFKDLYRHENYDKSVYIRHNEYKEEVRKRFLKGI